VDEVARVGREAGRREQDRASRPPFAFAWRADQTFTNPQDVIPVGYVTMDVATAERVGLLSFDFTANLWRRRYLDVDAEHAAYVRWSQG
jgi:hypothetical protein